MVKKLLILLVVLSIPAVFSAQTSYESFKSSKLAETREIKIKLPRNYEQNTQASYPLMIILDGDYLFEPIAGNIDYYSYWEDIPEMIVVGIDQRSTRDEDAHYDDQRFLPAEKGAAFFEFIGLELVPYLESKFRTAPFKVIAGHDYTANFINYYLLKERPLFQGYINLSPDLAPQMAERIQASLEKTPNKTWYYLATSQEDIPALKERILSFDSNLKNIDNENLYYNFDNFEHATHYTLVGSAIPRAIEQIFRLYRPISMEDYNRILLQSSVSGYDYLLEKYKNIKALFGIDKKIRINDFIAVYNAAEKTRNWNSLKDLSKLAAQHYPQTILSTYFYARYEEEAGDPKKAMKIYKNAYGQEPIAFLTVDFMLERANSIKKDFGY